METNKWCKQIHRYFIYVEKSNFKTEIRAKCTMMLLKSEDKKTLIQAKYFNLGGQKSNLYFVTHNLILFRSVLSTVRNGKYEMKTAHKYNNGNIFSGV